jgi:outer membrane protein assembly factor BamB
MKSRIVASLRARVWLAVVLGVAGCGCNMHDGSHDAGAASDDMASEAPDLAAMADLALPPDLSPSGPTQAYNFRIDPAHTGSQPRETLAPPLTRAWSVDVGAHATYALVARGRVFAAGGGGGTFPGDGNLVAVDIKTGEVLWGPLPLGSDLMIAYDDGLVFVTVGQTTLLALDETTGLTAWTNATAYSDSSPPVTANGLVYLNSESGNATQAFAQKTGALAWKTAVSDGSPGAPTIAEGVVYESSGCSLTNALDALTGQRKWTFTTGCTGGGGAMPNVWDGLVYVRDPVWTDYVILSADHSDVRGTFNSDTPMAFAVGVGYSLLGGTLRAVDLPTLSTRWSFRGDGHLVMSPLVAGAYTYVASSAGMLYALDGNGHTVWSDDTGATIGNDAEDLSLAVGEGTLLVPVGNHIVAYRGAGTQPGDVDMASPPDLAQPPDLAMSPGATQAPSFRIDSAHTAGQAAETMTPPLQLAWSYDAGDTLAYPLVASGRVFVSTASGLTTALDTRTGAVVWGPETLGRGMMYAYDGGRLIGANSSDFVQALDADTGAHAWTIHLGQLDSFAPPVAANGLVYVNGLESGGDTVALDERTGAIVWDNHTFDGTNGAVAVADGVVYEIEGCLQVHAWTAGTGAERWSHATGCTGGGGTTPAVYQGRLYVRDTTNTIFDANSDSVVGTFSTALPPAFANGIGYYLQSGKLVAIPVGGTAASWSFDGDGALAAAPVAAGAFVYVGSSLGNVYAVDGSGTQVWTTTLAAGVNAKPETNSMAVAEGTLLVPAGNVLYAFRSATP